PNRVAQIDFERFQVSIIDADELRPGGEHAVEVGRLVKFYERRQSQLDCLVVELAKMAIVETFGNQQHGVRPGGTRFDELIAIEDKVLAKHWNRHRLSDLP